MKTESHEFVPGTICNVKMCARCDESYNNPVHHAGKAGFTRLKRITGRLAVSIWVVSLVGGFLGMPAGMLVPNHIIGDRIIMVSGITLASAFAVLALSGLTLLILWIFEPLEDSDDDNGNISTE